MEGQQMCPVCTLYLRPGMRLQDHLFTHPKDQVIEALVRLSVSPSPSQAVHLTGPEGGAGAGTGVGATTINTNSQFTAITYRQFQTLTTSVPDAQPMMLNPCLVTQSFTNPPTFTSGVIRSSVPLLSYPYYPPLTDQQPSANFNQQNRSENNIQSTYSYSTQTTQTPERNSPLITQNSPFQEANCEVTHDDNENFQPAVDPFMNERIGNQDEVHKETLLTENLAELEESRENTFMNDSNICDVKKSVENSLVEDGSNSDEDCFDNDDLVNMGETEVDPFIENRLENIHEGSFVDGRINSVHEASIDPFVEDRTDIPEPTIDPFVDEIIDVNSKNQRDHRLSGLRQRKMRGKSTIESTPSLGTVISNTHRLIANDPTLDYDQDLRTDELVNEYCEHSYGHNRLSPSHTHNLRSPVSDSSNWSTGSGSVSGLRVRRDLNNVVPGSDNCIQYVVQNANATEYVTSDLYDDDQSEHNHTTTHHQTQLTLTNLDSVNVNYSIGLNYTTNEQLANMHIDDGEENNKEENSSHSTPLNIHSDELMPPRGELSGQESLGATENSVWEVQDEEESSVNNYKVRWQSLSETIQDVVEQGVAATVTVPTSQCAEPDTGAGARAGARVASVAVRCLECEMTFSCVKERRIHVQSVHKTPRHTQVNTQTRPQIIKIKQEKFSINTEASFRTCMECGLELQSVKELRKHKKEFHELKRKCHTCDTLFDDNPSYKEHISKVHPIECNVCGKLFTNRTAANAHTKVHLKYKPYQCTVCDKSFTSQMKLNEHNNVHSGETPYKCPMCDQTFRRQSNLIQHKNHFHLKIKKKIKDYFCHCGEIFHSIKKLHWHKETHDSKPKQCMYCSERYIHSTSLTRHIRHAHDSTYLPKPTSSLNIICPVCKITCIRTSLAQHMKIHTGERPFSCTICTKEFSTNWNLQMHKWTHASRSSKPFKCKLCKCAFYMLASYQAHIRSHRNIRPYTCNYCGRQFIRKYNCVRHVREHESNKSYCCAVCNKTFHRSYYLTEHMRTHTGVKPYTCHICSKTSSTKSNHNKHVRTHHAREPVNTEG